MLLLDSFTIDHTRIAAPMVRLAKNIQTPHGDIITIFDLRFCQPNVEIMSEKGMHTMEHLLAQFMRNYLNGEDIKIIDISPMGCRTGFYMVLIGTPAEQLIVDNWIMVMLDILKIKHQQEILELNKYQCGSYQMHSLEEAQNIAQHIIDHPINVMKNNELTLSPEKLIQIA